MSKFSPINTVLASLPAADDDASDFACGLLAGLSAGTKRIPCKYFYDAEGSALFERICALPEYYVTRTELDLLARRAAEFAALIGPDAEVVEFGAGSGRKVQLLLDALDRPRAYLPIDISSDYLAESAARLAADYPELIVKPIAADFSRPVVLPVLTSGARRRVGFFPGSTIGNFAPDAALRFLASAARLLKGGGLLIGVDLVKSPAILHAAYNDAAGVTEAFNKNLLARANRELGADFDPSQFHHHACYNPLLQRIEMYLISAARQCVRIDGRAIAFAEGEAVHTENSHKYTIEGFCALAVKAGFTPRAVWHDPERLFSMHWLDANGPHMAK
jgi:dimethylhistidine N-methyltransferase